MPVEENTHEVDVVVESSIVKNTWVEAQLITACYN